MALTILPNQLPNKSHFLPVPMAFLRLRHGVSKHFKKGNSIMQAMNRKYQEMFKDFNQRYFSGKLPTFKIRIREQMRKPRALGHCIRAEKLIEVRLRRNPDEVIEILLHEMAHAAVDEVGHWEKFLTEMYRLERVGAPVGRKWSEVLCSISFLEWMENARAMSESSGAYPSEKAFLRQVKKELKDPSKVIRKETYMEAVRVPFDPSCPAIVKLPWKSGGSSEDNWLYYRSVNEHRDKCKRCAKYARKAVAKL